MLGAPAAACAPAAFASDRTRIVGVPTTSAPAVRRVCVNALQTHAFNGACGEQAGMHRAQSPGVPDCHTLGLCAPGVHSFPAALSHCQSARRTRSPISLSCASEPTSSAEGLLSDEDGEGRLQVQMLFRYPLKSGAACALSQASVCRDGIRGDRQWMVATRGGKCLTQREMPQLATITAVLQEGGVNAAGSRLSLSAPNRPTLNISTRSTQQRVPATIWGTTVMLTDEGSEAARWLTDALGSEKRSLLPMFNMPTYRLLRVPARGSGRRAGLADVAPIHLLCESSVVAINARRASEGLQPVPTGRFRPNLLISGCAPHEEETWRGCVTVGDVTFRIDSPCPRCSVPDVDQATGLLDPPLQGPVRTLRLARKLSAFGAINFGIYMSPVIAHGEVTVGAPLRVHPCVSV